MYFHSKPLLSTLTLSLDNLHLIDIVFYPKGLMQLKYDVETCTHLYLFQQTLETPLFQMNPHPHGCLIGPETCQSSNQRTHGLPSSRKWTTEEQRRSAGFRLLWKACTLHTRHSLLWYVSIC